MNNKFTVSEQHIIDEITNLNDLLSKINDQRKEIYSTARDKGVDIQKIKDYIKVDYKKPKKQKTKVNKKNIIKTNDPSLNIIEYKSESGIIYRCYTEYGLSYCKECCEIINSIYPICVKEKQSKRQLQPYPYANVIVKCAKELNKLYKSEHEKDEESDNSLHEPNFEFYDLTQKKFLHSVDWTPNEKFDTKLQPGKYIIDEEHLRYVHHKLCEYASEHDYCFIRDKNKILNISDIIDCFPCLKLQSGFKLRAIPHYSGLLIYADKNRDATYTTESEYFKKYLCYTDALGHNYNHYTSIRQTIKAFRYGLEVEDSPEGYFDLLLLTLYTKYKYLWDHENYYQKTFLFYKDLLDIFMNYDPEETLNDYTQEDFEKLKLKDIKTYLEIDKKNNIFISILMENPWRGIFLEKIQLTKYYIKSVNTDIIVKHFCDLCY